MLKGKRDWSKTNRRKTYKYGNYRMTPELYNMIHDVMAYEGIKNMSGFVSGIVRAYCLKSPAVFLKQISIDHENYFIRKPTAEPLQQGRVKGVCRACNLQESTNQENRNEEEGRNGSKGAERKA